MQDIAQWLEQHGLGKYAEVFTENEVDIGDLAYLSEDDLQGIGLPLGPRKRLLAAIQSLDTGQTTATQSLTNPVKPASRTTTTEAEHRQLTVMFCDLVGSVAFGERMDVEDYRDLLATFRQAVVGSVERYEGFVARHHGDGLLVYFGYPLAHENDAERAVKAGLEVVRAVEGLEHTYDTRPQVRVGIATGPAVVGDVLSTGASERSELAALGPTPNLAARLQGEAEPNSVVISEITQRLVSGYFSLEVLGARELKGFSGEITLYRATGELLGQTRFSARAGMQLSPFVAREEEVELLHRRWRRAADGHGQVVLLMGEAGIGKSRLLRQHREDFGAEHETIHLQCSPYHESSALYPVIEAFERVLRSLSTGVETSRLERLRAHLRHVDKPEDESAEFLADMLSIPTEGRLPRAEGLDGQQRRERTLRTLVDYIQKLAAKLPILCVFEDVHWADPSTLELLGRLVETVESERVLMLVTSRPGIHFAWSDLSHVSNLNLSRLGRAAGEQLATAVAAIGETLPAELVETIVSRAGGNPLFIEELTRTVVQSDNAHRSERHMIPATIQDSLMARLDALQCGKPVAQCASVIGMECLHGLLASVWDGSTENLSEGLNELEVAGLLYRRGEGEDSNYVFKHALVRDAAYNSLLRDRRATMHQRVAAGLQQEHPKTAENQPELLAHHFSEAGLIEQAIEYWHRAGQRALSRSAHTETIADVTRALDRLTILPESVERTTLELGLRITLGPALMNTKGSASLEVRKTYQRARELSETVDKPEQKFTACWGLWLHYQVSGQFEAARRTAEEVLRIGAQLSDSIYLLQGHHAAWTTEAYIGCHAKSLAHANDGLAIYDIHRHRQSASMYGDHDAGVCGFTHRAHANYFLGYPDQAAIDTADTLKLAELVSHPLSLADAQCYAAIIYQLRREPKAVLRQANDLMTNSVNNELVTWRHNAEILLGWATATLYDKERGIAMMRAALKDREARGTKMRQVYYLAILAELLGDASQVDAGLVVVDQALVMLDQSGERRWEPLVHRIKGDLLCTQQDLIRAELCLKLSLNSARRDDAKSFELAAAHSLARLYNNQGRSTDAQDLLAPIYNWFTEGLETSDLKDAKTLLDQLC